MDISVVEKTNDVDTVVPLTSERKRELFSVYLETIFLQHF